MTGTLMRTRINLVRAGILSFCGRANLSGLRAADFGYGSGISSLAIIEAGASELISIAPDAQSAATIDRIRKHAGAPLHWTVAQGSALDPTFLGQFGQFDLVYCRNALHHTGDVWAGIDQIAKLVAPTGLLYLALCDSDVYPQAPEYWQEMKRKYASFGKLRRHLFEAWYLIAIILKWNPFRLPSLIRLTREYKATQGMHLHMDIKDWLGGWPMEFTRIYEVIPALQRHALQLLRTKVGEGNTEYLFGGPSVTPSQSLFSPMVLPDPLEWHVTSLRTCEDFSALSDRHPVYIYGTGQGGDQAYDAVIKATGKAPAGFITTHRDGRHRDLAVSTIQNFMKTASKEEQIVVASSYFDEISLTLIRHGVRRFYNAYPYLLTQLQ